MFNVQQISVSLSRKNLPENPTPDDILNAFLYYLTSTGTGPYDHQEEAILGLFAGNNVILNTPHRLREIARRPRPAVQIPLPRPSLTHLP